MHATIDPRQWPGRVVPETDAQVAAAVESLCLRAQWATANRARVAAVVGRWFDRGWCVDAVLRAVDLTPSGTLQRRKGDRQEAHLFLRDRLRFWFADDGADSATEPLRPPVQGMTFAQWWDISRRNERTNRVRRRAPLTAEGEKARAEARATVRTNDRDAIATARTRGRLRQDALDSLLPAGTPPPTFEDSHRPAPPRPVDRRVGNWVGRQQVIADDPTVRKALDVVLTSEGRPTPEAVARLRNAVRDARWTAEMAGMEAITTPTSATSPPLGREARRVLDYVEQAIKDDLPFDVMVFLLRDTTRPRPRRVS
ncbi:hypothetical protein [Actinosynnema sp. NPDC020468]|uniref:hypothetical protein n=1 Tax=Actinosynnema sp. NPDC020468 TaxID=3154488 RepID=UPI0033D03C33